MSETVIERVSTILADIVQWNPASLKPDTELYLDLGLDSAGALELLVTLEDAFDIHIRTDDAREVRTLADMVALVEKALG